ncbi:MAG: linear amide C-N hydrolase [Spirochaetes bacterium]|nr:linear amide C-N hydrolase [Spirochaetota bacterium]
MYHPRFKGSHYEIGLKFGSRLKKYRINVDKIIKLDNFQTDFGIKSEKVLAKVFPEVCDEIRGLTDGLNYPYEKFASWLLCMSCCYDPKGCTAFSFKHNNKIYYGRNNDLPPFLKKESISPVYNLNGNFSFIGTTSSMINLEEGLNEKGLIASMTFVFPDKIVPGINTVFMVRYFLEKCDSVKAAVQALQSLPVASAGNILLADKSGEMLVAEFSPDKINIRKPAKGENFVITVNHFTSNEMKKHYNKNMPEFLKNQKFKAEYDYLQKIDNYSATERYETAYNALKNTKIADAVEHTKNILSGRYGFMCRYDRELDFDTIWASVFDLSGNMVYRAEGNPAKVKFSEDIRYRQKILNHD